ncbi:hypothetical protein EDB19DRAFT_1662611 [Suillus lakei]|nr:hypothetical protein EDB19DRAFT_1662611 [Suillus lakei]
MYLPWLWPRFGFLGVFFFLNDFRLASFTKVWPTLLVETVLNSGAYGSRSQRFQYSGRPSYEFHRSWCAPCVCEDVHPPILVAVP